MQRIGIRFIVTKQELSLLSGYTLDERDQFSCLLSIFSESKTMYFCQGICTKIFDLFLWLSATKILFDSCFFFWLKTNGTIKMILIHSFMMGREELKCWYVSHIRTGYRVTRIYAVELRPLNYLYV